MTTELKPCPFCGSTAIEVKGEGEYRPQPSPDDYDYNGVAECQNCGAEAAVETWNTRTDPPAPAPVR